jgi:hypothetical protein
MDIRRINSEIILYTLAIVLAVSLRFYNLGAPPLSDEEAKWAMQALQVARPALTGGDFVIGPQPAYVFLTGVMFVLFGSSNFLARFWPALAGTVLILLPVFLRSRLGRYAAIIMAFGLAVDPGLVTVSRQAGGPMMAVSFGLMALGLWIARNAVLSGSFVGLASMSGPVVFTGGISFSLAWVAGKFSPKRRVELNPSHSTSQEVTLEDDIGGSAPDQEHVFPTRANIRWFLISAGAAILLLGTLFFRYPQGLVALFSTLPIYLQGWLVPSGIPALRLLAALLVFQPFALFFGVVGAARWLVDRFEENNRYRVALLIPVFWTVILLVMLLLYPARQVSDLAWALVPLWALAAWELQRYLPEKGARTISIILASFVFILFALFWNTLIAFDQPLFTLGAVTVNFRAAVAAGILAMTALTIILVSLGWSWRVARFGLVWGTTAAFTLYLLSLTWGASQLRPNEPQELWSLGPGGGQAALFETTLNDLSARNVGYRHQIDILTTVDTPSMRWVLRNYPQAQFTAGLKMGELPSVIITRQEGEAPQLSTSYRGQDFVWWQQPGWSGVLPTPILPWLTFREAEIKNETVILWARSDLFPDGTLDLEEDLSEDIQ